MRSRLEKLTFLKYIIAGGIGGSVHLLLLFVFTDICKIHYLLSTTTALFIVFWISFFLQKHWTFRDKSSDKIGLQAGRYFIMHSLNFVANGALMYVFVSVFGIWYLFSQVLISLSIAVVTFVANKKYIFTQAAGLSASHTEEIHL